MAVSVYDTDFVFGNFKMFGDELQDAGICHIPLGFFFYGNFKMVGFLFFKRFFFSIGSDDDVDVTHIIILTWREK